MDMFRNVMGLRKSMLSYIHSPGGVTISVTSVKLCKKRFTTINATLGAIILKDSIKHDMLRNVDPLSATLAQHYAYIG